MKSSRSSSTGTPNGRISGLPASLPSSPTGTRDRDQAAVADPPPLVDGRAVGGQDHVAVEHQPADADLVDLLGLAGREADDVAVLLHHRVRHAVAEREPGMLGQVPRLAMDRNDDLGPDPFVHLDELGPAGVAGDMDVGLASR